MYAYVWYVIAAVNVKKREKKVNYGWQRKMVHTFVMNII